ncbi:hypothetical protein ACHAW6_007241 [Cyclotella cf. meneghiniana]
MEASLEILTDGSDLTGGPAVFLTLRKSKSIDKQAGKPSSTSHQDVVHYEIPSSLDEGEGSITARYNLTGLPSLTGRLASDQSFKLLSDGAFRCILLPSLTPDSTGGLAAFFLSLVQAGYAVSRPRCLPAAKLSDRDGSDDESTIDGNEPCDHSRQWKSRSPYGDISIIGPQNTCVLIDGVLDTLFGNGRNRPAIRLCEVPSPSKDNRTPECCWWDVYQDLYIRVWGQSVVKPCRFFCKRCNGNGGKPNKRRRDEQSMEESLNQKFSSSFNASPITSTHHSTSTCHFVIYIVMVKPSVQQNNSSGHQSTSSPISFAILPHFASNEPSQKCQTCGENIHWNYSRQSSLVWEALRNLPQEIIDAATLEKGQGSRSLLDFMLHLNPLSWEIDGLDVTVNGLPVKKPTADHRSECSGPDTLTTRLQEVPKRIIPVPVSSVVNLLTSYHLATFPDRHKGPFDPGILIRAQRRSFRLNKYLPFAFYLGGGTRSTTDDCDTPIPVGCNISNRNIIAFQLRSCTSVLLHETHLSHHLNGDVTAFNNQHHCPPFRFISRIENICNRCGVDGASVLDSSDDSILDPEIVSSLKRAYTGTSVGNEEAKAKAEDVNEIDLDGSSVSGDEAESKENQHERHVGSDASYPDVVSPHLLLLGTGCATPSPLRGSSSYALFMPTSESNSAENIICNKLVLTAIIECGEGALTSLSRYLLARNKSRRETLCLDEQLRWVQFIWISHSHLDHYGDLPSVVKAITESKDNETSPVRPLIVIAPSKVLKFLRVMLGPRAGRKYATYVGITHREFQFSPFASSIRSMLFEYSLSIPSRCINELAINDDIEYTRKCDEFYCPFMSLRNVEVKHCQDAFALLLELRFPRNGKTQRFLLCFSGDTRPSDNLVRECRSYNCTSQSVTTTLQQTPAPLPPPPRVSLLLHESTFLNDKIGKVDAVKKRHSTVSEAFCVAERMQVEACLLTHFSQRYSHISIQDACSDNVPLYNLGDVCSSQDSKVINHTFSYGVGVDGMVVPLTKLGTASLHQLSHCIDKLV